MRVSGLRAAQAEKPSQARRVKRSWAWHESTPHSRTQALPHDVTRQSRPSSEVPAVARHDATQLLGRAALRKFSFMPTLASTREHLCTRLTSSQSDVRKTCTIWLSPHAARLHCIVRGSCNPSALQLLLPSRCLPRAQSHSWHQRPRQSLQRPTRRRRKQFELSNLPRVIYKTTKEKLRPIPHRNFQWVSRPITLFLVPLFRNGAKFFLRFRRGFGEDSARIFSKCELQKCSSHFD